MSIEGTYSGLYRAQESMSQWITENRPTTVKSQLIHKLFMHRFGSKITGSEEFVKETKKVIEKASKLATGVTVMQRLLDTGRDLLIKEGQSDFFERELMNDGTPSLSFSFCNPTHHYIHLKDGKERDISQSFEVTTFIHECLHAWHHFTNSKEAREKAKGPGVLPEMDSAEEELVITGNLHLEEVENADFCCENTALMELGGPLRINHQGIVRLTGEKSDLHEYVRTRILHKIRELIAEGKIHNDKIDIGTPIEIAMRLYLLETHPEPQQEWIEVMTTLIRSGCHSKDILKLALLQNSQVLLDALLEAGEELTDDLLDEAVKECSERFDIIWKELEMRNWVITKKALNELTKQRNVVTIEGCDPPYIRGLKERDIQHGAVKSKFVGDRTLPIHTLQNLFNSKKLKNAESFADWVKSHSFRPKRNEADNGAFELTSDGRCILSKVYNSRYPVCNKHQKQIPFESITQEDISKFINVLRVSDWRKLAGALSDNTMKILHLGYQKTMQSNNPHSIKDHELSNLLSDRIQEEITKAFSDPNSLSEEKSSTPAYYFDVSLLNPEGNGLLQREKNCLEGKYSDAIDNLKDDEGKPITSAHYRLSATELIEYRSMGFWYELWINGEMVCEDGFN